MTDNRDSFLDQERPEPREFNLSNSDPLDNLIKKGDTSA